MESTQHKISIAKEKDVQGHNEFIPKIGKAITRNKSIYSKKSTSRSKPSSCCVFKINNFCQSQKFTFMQTTALAKFLKELTLNQNDLLIIGASEREEISLVAKSFGRSLLNKLKQDLSNIPYSIMLDSSTMNGRNVTILKVRYPKQYIDSTGIKKTKIENRTLGIKYFSYSSTALSILKTEVVCLRR